MPAFVLPCLGFKSVRIGPPKHFRTERDAICLRKTSFRGRGIALSQSVVDITQRDTPRPGSTPCMFGGGGILGVGPSEVIVIVAVGWLLLGPEKLFALAKDSGKLFGDIRRTANEAKDTFSEALDLDMLAAELEQSTKSKEEVDEDKKSDDSIKENEDIVPGADLPQEAPVDSLLNEVLAEQEDVVGSNFLEQLQRVSDPNQIAPSEVPDLSVDLEELELERLEKEYNTAKERLESRKNQAKATGESGPIESVSDER